MTQDRLFSARPRTAQSREVQDFVGALGNQRAFPSTLRVLEHNGHLLVVKHYGHKQQPGEAQRRLFNTLVQYGNNPDAPGSISVLLLWGIPETSRSMQVWDWRGPQPIQHDCGNDAIKAALSAWWRGAEGR